MLELRAIGRMLWRTRGSSAAAVFMLAAAATAATATFALADAVLWRSLPYRDATKLVRLVTTHGTTELPLSIQDLTVLRDKAQSARVVAAGLSTPDYALTGFGEPRQVQVRVLTAGYFETLGVPLLVGREFRREEERSGSGFAVILTDRLWGDIFNRRPDIIGTTLPLNGRSYSIVGVVAPYRDPFGDVDAYLPQQFAPSMSRRFRLLSPIARLAPGATIEQFRSEVSGLTNVQDPLAVGFTVRAVSFRDRFAAKVGSSVAFLFAGGSALLLIALLNFSMLAAARVHQRMADFSLRFALGATRFQILRLAAAEAAVLAALAALLSAAMSTSALPLLRDRYGDGALTDISMGVRTLGFLAGIAVVAVIVASIAASRAFSRRITSERTILSSRLRMGRALVVGQVGISLALVVSSALLAKSFQRLSHVDPGFAVKGIFTTRIALPAVRYAKPAQRLAFWNTVLSRLEGQGIESAAITSELPLTGKDNAASPTAKSGSGDVISMRIRSVSPKYFDVMHIASTAGRGILPGDSAEAPKVVVINEQLAAHLRPLGEPVGQTLAFDFVDPPYMARVVGVVRDIRHSNLSTAPTPEAYFPSDQTPQQIDNLVVSGPANERDVSRLVRATFNGVDASQPFGPVVSVSKYVEQNLARPSAEAQLAGLFAAVALIVATSGLYSLLAYLVASSRREWGVRLALGASQASLRYLVLRQSVAYAAMGVGVGVLLLLVARSTLNAVLFGVAFWDPMAIAGSAAVLTAVCVIAATIPAIRASRISAAEALRA